MKKIKTIIVFLLSVLVVTAGLTACGTGSDQTEEPEGAEDKLSVVTTVFPVYDWTRNVAGADSDNMDITMLLDSGVDLHSFQPTAEDIQKIADCDVFIYVGGESDEWVEDALGEATNKDMKVVNLMDALGDRAKEEEIVEGMQAEDEHEHEHGDADHEEGHEDADHEEEEEGPEFDEHIWLSLRNASVLCDPIADALGSADAANAEKYKENAESYKAELDKLDSAYEEAISSASVKTLLFGDRFPFRYMTDDYGLEYYAAFIGCSAETEASFETIAFLSDKVNELSLSCIMTIETGDKRIAESIINNTKSKDQKILTLDSMQSTTSADADGGATYLGVMESNLEVLKEALK